MLTVAADMAAAVAAQFWSKAQDTFLSATGSLSFAQLAGAFLIASTSIILARRAKGKRVRARAFVRTFFARRIFLSRSAKLDYKLALFNIFVAGALFGWAVLSHHTIGVWTNDVLVALFGARPASTLPDVVVGALTMCALFLAYEFAYWSAHYLCHKTPLLWEFHKIHHQAETLTPVTNFRVHPVDTIVFYNILAICSGLAKGVSSHAFGAVPMTFSGGNLLFLIFAFTTLHLQHSHVWIAFTGIWGRVFMSPAHHQIHHSSGVEHFDRNFGSSLAVFDWLFGTLHVPARERENLAFGVEGDDVDSHSVSGALMLPFVRAAVHLQADRGKPSVRSA